ncbi:M48 family metallopeptidase [Kitasatospora cinereorecta]|uniref:M48 family metallopeptidase n=1 Tax=Kitasatospora cinereorecta TaxID=285560 RepID=A0ABW0VDR9_9ACTN
MTSTADPASPAPTCAPTAPSATPQQPAPQPATPPAPSHCPDCDAPIVADPRFRTWCPACEWNLADPQRTPEARSAGARRRAARRARRTESRERAIRVRTEHVYAMAVEGKPSHRDASWLGAVVLAGLVHLTTAAVLVGSVAGLLSGSWPLRAIGVIGLVVSVLLRPRLGRLHLKHTAALTRTESPALYALADRVAEAVGARPVDTIQLDESFNAGFGRAGLRRRSRLVLGLPLWYGLTDRQRVALLAHEFGHDVNHDQRRGIWLRSALVALEEWCELTRPHAADRLHRHMVGVEAIARILLRTVNLIAYALLTALDVLTTRTGQLAEYRADLIAARVASPADASALLEVLLLDRTVATVAGRRRAIPPARHGRGNSRHPIPAGTFWDELAEQLASVPQGERERLLRLSERQQGSVDLSHPPTHLRIRLLAGCPAGEPAVRVDTAQRAAIDAELAPHRERIARSMGVG